MINAESGRSVRAEIIRIGRLGWVMGVEAASKGRGIGGKCQ